MRKVVDPESGFRSIYCFGWSRNILYPRITNNACQRWQVDLVVLLNKRMPGFEAA